MIRWLAILCFLAAPLPLYAQDADAPPAAAPPDFSHVAGQFRLSSSAAPTKVAVEEPITIKVQISGQASTNYRPQRENLRIFPNDLETSFYVEPVPEQDRLQPDRDVWEFVYRLRPKSAEVKAIPSLRLVYYAPVRKKFQTTFSDEIPITVKSATGSPARTEELKALPLPERFYKLYPAEEVLRDETPLRVSPLLAVLLFSLPPLVCVGWYWLWKLRHPGEKCEMHARRSRAARLALTYLEKQKPDPVRTAAALTDYLRARFELPPLEPTPQEIEKHLRRRGATKPTSRAWRDFFQTCDRLRFAPAPPKEGQDLPADAARLIHTVENDSCISR
ncbi:MAG: BatD family protein [Planctomycetes bacterium]|nr:BatD family protein [Planctomycetota bacterium]